MSCVSLSHILSGQAYHKSCFKCSHGGCPITPPNYAALEGVLYCKHHFSQLFKEKGSYNHLIKSASIKRPANCVPQAWVPVLSFAFLSSLEQVFVLFPFLFYLVCNLHCDVFDQAHSVIIVWFARCQRIWSPRTLSFESTKNVISNFWIIILLIWNIHWLSR